MKVLIVTAIYPTADNPAFGSYVHTQSESRRRFLSEILFVRGPSGPAKLGCEFRRDLIRHVSSEKPGSLRV
jgi:hypothetical protein